MERHDVIVIGGGSEGYNTAIRATQLGLRAACIERASQIGGEGPNTGCIPSRTLLHASEIYAAMRNGDYAALGVEGVTTRNLARTMEHKAAVIGAMATGIRALRRNHRVTRHHGHSRLAGAGKVSARAPNRTISRRISSR